MPRHLQEHIANRRKWSGLSYSPSVDLLLLLLFSALRFRSWSRLKIWLCLPFQLLFCLTPVYYTATWRRSIDEAVNQIASQIVQSRLNVMHDVTGAVCEFKPEQTNKSPIKTRTTAKSSVMYLRCAICYVCRICSCTLFIILFSPLFRKNLL